MSDHSYKTDAVAVTIDVDWAPDAVIQDTASLLDDYGVPATVFSTHNDNCDLTDDHERALHPNFFDSSDADALSDIARLYPDARGVRSHGLYTHTGLREMYDELGLTYESNYLLFGQSGIRPFQMHPDVIQFPIYFMDDMWLRRGRADFSVDEALEISGLTVFTFHPIHVYLNTPSIEFYEENKPQYDNPVALREARYQGVGVRNLFVELLEAANGDSDEVRTLGAIEDRLRTQT